MDQDKVNIQKRLNKIEGQLKGIQRMIDSEVCCVDVLVQVAAVKAAINKVGTLIFEKHAKDCLHKSLEKKSQDEVVEELMKVLTSFIR